MRIVLAKPIAAAALLLAMWGLDSAGGNRLHFRAGIQEAAGPVRILRFYASAGAILPGERAMLCYGVRNAKSVSISPAVRDVYPSPGHCLQIVPEHTTHYVLMAQGFDGTVDARSLTLPVEPAPPARLEYSNLALLFGQ